LRTILNLESDDTTWSATLWEYQRRNGCTGAVILCLTSFLVAALNSVEEHGTVRLVSREGEVGQDRRS
jgi:hypothetical protein